MHNFEGKTLSWQLREGVIELALHREPCNEIGLAMLEELEHFVAALPEAEQTADVMIIHSLKRRGSAPAPTCANSMRGCGRRA